MCGRYSLTGAGGDGFPALRLRFPIGESVALEPRWNIAPGTEVLTVGPDGGALVRWGLEAPWLRSPVINVRSETAAAKFGAALRDGRCLIPADGFYEWRGREAHRVTRADAAPFAFAGVRLGGTCAILTTQANAVLRPIHDRMPVMLPGEGEQEWLDPGTAPERLLALLRPWPEEETCAFRVGSAVNDARHDGPDCAEPAATLF